MNRILLIMISTLFLCSCDVRNMRKKDKDVDVMPIAFKDSTKVQMIDSVYSFGKVTDGEKVEYNFRFRNTGKHPLIVASATASCGCTVPEKPDEPIQPGQTGFLKVVFDSRGKVGDVHKQITVKSNAYPDFPELELQGEVMSKEDNN